jgi:hypothetical protein
MMEYSPARRCTTEHTLLYSLSHPRVVYIILAIFYSISIPQSTISKKEKIYLQPINEWMVSKCVYTIIANHPSIKDSACIYRHVRSFRRANKTCCSCSIVLSQFQIKLYALCCSHSILKGVIAKLKCM